MFAPGVPKMVDVEDLSLVSPEDKSHLRRRKVQIFHHNGHLGIRRTIDHRVHRASPQP